MTGGSSGLGRATALALAAAGADVAVLARGSAELEQTAEDVRAHGVRASTAVVDLADAGQVERAVAHVRAELGSVRLLVNAAGTDVPGPATELDVLARDRVLDVNLRAPFVLARTVWPHMHEGGRRDDRERVIGRRTTRMGKRLGLLRLQVRADR